MENNLRSRKNGYVEPSYCGYVQRTMAELCLDERGAATARSKAVFMSAYCPLEKPFFLSTNIATGVGNYSPV